MIDLSRRNPTETNCYTGNYMGTLGRYKMQSLGNVNANVVNDIEYQKKTVNSYFLPYITFMQNSLNLPLDFKFSAKDTNIDSYVTDPNFIVTNLKVYIIFANNADISKLNLLKLRLVENFLANWKPVNEVYSSLTETLNHITIATITTDNIYEYDFSNKSMPIFLNDKMRSDIQFIIWKGNDEDYRNGYYDETVKTHISNRVTNDRVTFIIYTGTEASYERNNYEKDLSFSTQIEHIKIDIQKEDSDKSEELNKTIRTESTGSVGVSDPMLEEDNL